MASTSQAVVMLVWASKLLAMWEHCDVSTKSNRTHSTNNVNKYSTNVCILRIIQYLRTRLPNSTRIFGPVRDQRCVNKFECHVFMTKNTKPSGGPLLESRQRFRSSIQRIHEEKRMEKHYLSHIYIILIFYSSEEISVTLARLIHYFVDNINTVRYFDSLAVHLLCPISTRQKWIDTSTNGCYDVCINMIEISTEQHTHVKKNVIEQQMPFHN